LHQDAGAVASARIGADGAAMLEIAKNRKSVLDDMVRFASLDVGNESNTARILVERWIIETLRSRQANRVVAHHTLTRERFSTLIP